MESDALASILNSELYKQFATNASYSLELTYSFTAINSMEFEAYRISHCDCLHWLILGNSLSLSIWIVANQILPEAEFWHDSLVNFQTMILIVRITESGSPRVIHPSNPDNRSYCLKIRQQWIISLVSRVEIPLLTLDSLNAKYESAINVYSLFRIYTKIQKSLRNFFISNEREASDYEMIYSV